MGSITTQRARIGFGMVAAAVLLTTACSPNGAPVTVPPDGSDTTTDPDTAADDNTDIATGSESESTSNAGGGTAGGTGTFVRALAPFDDCAAFLDHVKAEARARVGPYGLDEHGWWPWDMWDDADDAEEAAMDDAAPADLAGDARAASPDADGSDSAGGDYTDTNVQEVGVDEPDIIKTDGDRILVVRDDRLIHIDITGDAPRITDEITIPEGWGHELFFIGDRALLFTNGGEFVGRPHPIDTDDVVDDIDHGWDHGWYNPAAVIVEVDLADPNDLRITSTLSIEGQYLSARRIDDTIRLAVSTGPQQLPWVYPQGRSGEERAERTNREIVDESRIEDWIPEYRLEARGATTSGALLPCERLNHPADFSGFDVISVLTISLADGIATGFDPAKAVGVLGSGQTVYSSHDRFYVATTKWVAPEMTGDAVLPRGWSDDFETDVHAFAISTGEPAHYVASGTVAGSLLDQFSLDEHDGHLRVITTEGSPWDDRNLSETGLTVLAEQGDRLVRIGHVGGLGKGERLYSARLLDDVGFAVTFREIDPFYVLDLRDPTNPKVTGELKIPGFSTYLHPLDERRVLGIGQDATEQGRVLGLKVSIFDVSNPADPRETAIWRLPDGHSPAEYDHRAFQMWGSTAIVPFASWHGEGDGVVLLDVSDGIREIGRVSHERREAPPASDCSTITTDDAPQDSELFWMAQEAYTHVQLCKPGDRGGWGSHVCERIEFDELIWWGVDPERDLAALGATEGDRIEICWLDDDYGYQIERSLVADGVLYTLSHRAIQANAFDTLATIAQLPLR